MHVLVTGHRGYVGSVLVPMLQDAGHRVTGLDIDYYRACDFGGGLVPPVDIQRDLRDVRQTDFSGVDTVIHLAALSNDPLGALDADLTHQINTVATLRLAELCKASGVSRFVFSSSCSNYGAAKSEWLTEDAPLNPVTAYAVSKVECEAGLDRLADASFTPVYLRSGTAYGMSPRIRFDLVANNLTAWAVATGMVRLKSDGLAWRPLVHVEDMAQAFVLAVTAPKEHVHRQAFNVGVNADCMRIRELASIIQQEVPYSEITFSDDHIADTRTYCVDCGKIQSLGFAPKWDVTRGVRDLYGVFSAERVKVEEFEGETYQRVAHIRGLVARGTLDRELRYARANAR